MFLLFDNEDKKKNRILLFISSTGINILQKAEEYHLDGTLKLPRNMHVVIDKISNVCAYIFLHLKNCEIFEKLRNIITNGLMDIFRLKFETTAIYKNEQTIISKDSIQNHPKFSDLVECFKKEDAKTRNVYLNPKTKSRQSQKDQEKDFQIQLIQEDFDQNQTEERLKSQENGTIQTQVAYEQENNSMVSNQCQTEEEKEAKKSKTETGTVSIEIKQEKQSPPTTSASFDNSRIYTVDERIQVEPFNFALSDGQWLMGRHIDLAFDYIQSHSRNSFLYIANNWKCEDFLIHESPEMDKIFVVSVNNLHWIILTNINPSESENNQSLDQNWFVYYSMNNINNCMATAQIFKLIYPDRNFHRVYMVQSEHQIGSNDCGLFAIAYAQLLAERLDPFNYKFDQRLMRITYYSFITFGSLYDFYFEIIAEKQK
ncbi:hypothetical protein BpHYR1_018010 [Brachionus plicatilis]|uniref:Ubiquitin-like protease family profile domain-containing protein n=1 Tax=Brachionus plicatilis TaxID=10195 RepID=A0A3M7PF90_BRAPC|nr:hypothetical protein BpHYR1_018010 [Brachionus plicatilis]